MLADFARRVTVLIGEDDLRDMHASMRAFDQLHDRRREMIRPSNIISGKRLAESASKRRRESGCINKQRHGRCHRTAEAAADDFRVWRCRRPWIR